jgi:3-hydroxyisobutyrate dehydrogenase/2-hydroxy-3-oxopropionate reductase
MATVGFVGLGRMGSRMAARLLDAGEELVVWNRSAERAESLTKRGAVRVATPRRAAEAADCVITMVADPSALDAVINGVDGIAAGVTEDTTVIQMATVGVDATKRTASMLPQGAMLDAPVLGSISEADAGTLMIFIGGPEALIKRWLPVLEVLGSPLVVGGVGAGSAAKLVANMTLFGSLGVLGEALRLGDRLGVPRGVLFEVLARTPIAAQSERRRPAIESGEFPPRFALSLAIKDIDLILQADEDADLRLTTAARSWLEEAGRAGWGDRDYASVIEFILQHR